MGPSETIHTGREVVPREGKRGTMYHGCVGDM